MKNLNIHLQKQLIGCPLLINIQEVFAAVARMVEIKYGNNNMILCMKRKIIHGHKSFKSPFKPLP